MSDIVLDFHNALCDALCVPIRLTPWDRSRWERFIFEINQALEEDQKLTIADVGAVVAMMRKQNDQGKAGWGLRYKKIIEDSETFRDLVIESRRRFRPQKPRTMLAEQKLGEVRRQVEVPTEEVLKKEQTIRKDVTRQADLFFEQFGHKRKGL